MAAHKEDAAAWLNLGLLQRQREEKDGDVAVLRAIALNPELKDPEPAKATGATSG